MKKLFCAVATEVDGNLDSPLIYHIKTENRGQAEECVRELLEENGFDAEVIEQIFDIFIFEVTERDIIEA